MGCTPLCKIGVHCEDGGCTVVNRISQMYRHVRQLRLDDNGFVISDLKDFEDFACLL